MISRSRSISTVCSGVSSVFLCLKHCFFLFHHINAPLHVITGVRCICKLIAEEIERDRDDAKNGGRQKHLVGVKGEGSAAVVDHVAKRDGVNGHTYANEVEKYLRADGIGDAQGGFHNDQTNDVRDDIARSDAAHGGTQTLGGDVILRIANGENMHR